MPSRKLTNVPVVMAAPTLTSERLGWVQTAAALPVNAEVRRDPPGRRLSVSDVARLADVGQSTLHAWEAGRSTPQIDLLARVIAILKATIEQVVIIGPDQRYPGDWRVLRGITQPELAAGAKIATTTLRGIERADIALTDANAATLAGLLGIGVDEHRAAYPRARGNHRLIAAGVGDRRALSRTAGFCVGKALRRGRCTAR